jgi:hypothetical protein
VRRRAARTASAGRRPAAGPVRATPALVPPRARGVQGRLGARRADSVACRRLPPGRDRPSRGIAGRDLGVGMGCLERSPCRASLRPARADEPVRPDARAVR